MQVDFYQLGTSRIVRVLARIGERVLADGGRLLVVTGDAQQAAAIDAELWTDQADSFLPHGCATADDAGADQPILIGEACAAANRARNVALVDGLWRDEALAFDRAFHFFDAATIDAARAAWRSLGGRAGVTRNYWAQDDAGRWGKMA